MSKEDLKIIIIGGGIAGLSAGINLIRAGYKPVIFERNKNLKEKLCGGILTQRAIKELDLLQVEYKAILHKPQKINIQYKNKEILTFDNEKEIYIVKRKHIDQLVLNKYLKLGGRIEYNKNIVEIDYKNNTIKTTDKQEYIYDKLLISNGANSRFRKELNQEPLEKVLCIENKEPLDIVKDNRVATINFLKGKTGYSWELFSKQEKIQGLGFLGTFEEAIEEYRNIFGEVYNIKGAYVPYGKQPKQSTIKDIYFIGDAGGYVNPLLAEGISYSMASSRAITEIIDKQNYNIDKELRKSISSYLFLRTLFYLQSDFMMYLIKTNQKKAINICKSIILSDTYNQITLFDLIKN